MTDSEVLCKETFILCIFYSIKYRNFFVHTAAVAGRKMGQF